MSFTIFHKKIFTVCAIAIIAFLGYSIAKKFPQFLATQKEVRYADIKLLETEEYQKNLEQESLQLGENAYLEQQARLKLNYRKSGEKVVYIYHAASPTPEPKSEALNVFQRLWYRMTSK